MDGNHGTSQLSHVRGTQQAVFKYGTKCLLWPLASRLAHMSTLCTGSPVVMDSTFPGSTPHGSHAPMTLVEYKLNIHPTFHVSVLNSFREAAGDPTRLGPSCCVEAI